MLAAVFLPVLCCVIFVGNRMDYNDTGKLATLLPNWMLFLVALAGIAMIGFLFWKERKRVLSAKENQMVNIALALLFTGLFFLNTWMVKKIAFQLPWDIMVVSGCARMAGWGEKLGYYYYLSMYSNNIPITYFLAKIYEKAMILYPPHLRDYLWLQVGCAWISIGGYFSCLTVKKLTQRCMPVIAVLLLYLALPGISPWKMAPYTDVYGMIFPIISIYFYVSYRKDEKTALKYICLLLALSAGMLGGLMKPSVYLIVIAILGVEAFYLWAKGQGNVRYFCFAILISALLAFGLKMYRAHMIDDIGLEFNPEIEADWSHYLRVGLNESTTGGYNSDDAAIFGAYQNDRAGRQKKSIEDVAARLQERGLWGTVWFWVRKMTMVFNDGTFGWGGGEAWVHEYYSNWTGETAVTKLLRDIFWLGVYTGRYNTFCQLAWIFSMLCIPGIALAGKKWSETFILSVSFLGIFFYQMLFEARARYLFVFLPLLCAIAICGLWEYVVFLEKCLERRRKKAGDGNLQS